MPTIVGAVKTSIERVFNIEKQKDKKKIKKQFPEKKEHFYGFKSFSSGIRKKHIFLKWKEERNLCGIRICFLFSIQSQVFGFPQVLNFISSPCASFLFCSYRFFCVKCLLSQLYKSYESLVFPMSLL